MHEESPRLVIITAAAVTLFINKEGRGKYNTSREGEDEEKRRKELVEKERKNTEGEIRVTKWRKPQHILPMASL